MKRIYVIMEDTGSCDPYNGERDAAEPIDFKYSMTEAEDACFKYEQENPGVAYYWREVIGE